MTSMAEENQIIILHFQLAKISKNKVYSTEVTLQRIVRYAFREIGHAMNSRQNVKSHNLFTSQ